MKLLFTRTIYAIAFLTVQLLSGNNSGLAGWITVVNSQSGEPIEGVSITLDKVYIGETGPLGKLLLDNSVNPNSTLGFHHTSYATKFLTVKQLSAQGNVVQLLESVLNIQEVVIRANRSNQDYTKVAGQIQTVDAKTKDEHFHANSADVLGLNPAVFIQKSQSGGGSPMIRGMSTSRVLLMVDGIRMNNAIFRSGNVHNVISVDPESISNVEITMGPGSVIHGSDAMGGTMQISTYDAHYGDSTEVLQSLVFSLTHQSAELKRRPNFRLNYGEKNWGGMTAITYSQYDDVTMGKYVLPWTPKSHLDNALLTCVPISFAGFDTIRKPSSPYLQYNTAYEQRNLLQKFKVRLRKTTELKTGLHASLTTDINRYDRYIQTSGNLPKYARWSYGPQRWVMGYVALEDRSKTVLWDYFKLTASGQVYEESRNVRRFGRNVGDVQYEHVEIGQFNLDASKQLNQRFDIQYGAEYISNLVISKAHYYDITNPDTSWSAQSRYANGSTWRSASTFASVNTVLSEQWTASAGARLNYIHMFTPIDFMDFKEDATLQFLAPSAQMGLTYFDGDRKYFGLLSTGFRAPNIDDASKVFDSEPGALVVPNADLREERLWSAELGGSQKIGGSWVLDASAYYSFLNNALERAPFTFDGHDSIIFDGVQSQVLAIQNLDYAWIWGYQFGIRSDLSKNLRWTLQWAHPFGKDSNGEPLRHVAPFNANTSLTYRKGKWSVNFKTLYAGEISADELARSERSKEHMYAMDDDGRPYAPAYVTANLHTAYVYNDNIVVRFGIDNLMDVRYRPYSSGITAPGRSVFIKMTGSI
jgi:hemoglobin/transferrin/lactoferrin receptor protein